MEELDDIKMSLVGYSKVIKVLDKKLYESDIVTYEAMAILLEYFEIDKGMKLKRANKPTPKGTTFKFEAIKDLKEASVVAQKIIDKFKEFEEKYGKRPDDFAWDFLKNNPIAIDFMKGE